MIDASPDRGRTEVLRRNTVFIVVLLAVAASITGIRNGFALDDIEVIIRNPRLHTLAAPWHLVQITYWRPEMGATLYRPLTMLAFAFQWSMGGGSALPFHAVSIGLYAFLSAAVYRLARLVMGPAAALVAAALFAVHPVHVEAVANVVGQSELWVAVIIVLVVVKYIEIRRVRQLKLADVLLLSAAYLTACGFKEHAIVLPALLLCAEFLLVGDQQPFMRRVRSFAPLVVALAAAACLFLAARYSVLHGAMLDSRALIYREQSFATRLFTQLSVVLEWIRLFVWPMTLSADYSFPRIRTHAAFEMSMLPAVAVVFGLLWIAWHVRKRHPVATFGLAWIAISMIIPSNLVIVTGFVLAERTLMLASVGLALCAGAAFASIGAVNTEKVRAHSIVSASAAALLLLFGARSMTRGPVWRDNAALVDQTVQDVPSSHRAHWMRADLLAENKRWPEALQEMDLAVTLGEPNDALLLESGGDMFAMNGRCPRALTLYRRALALRPLNAQLRANTSLCLLNIGKLAEAKSVALGGQSGPSTARLQRLATAADSLQLARGRGRALR